MASDKVMNRLIQGDVGSGKTVIAQLALLKICDAGYQGCLMAPTEVLAKQHFESFMRDFEHVVLSDGRKPAVTLADRLDDGQRKKGGLCPHKKS